LAVPLPDRCGHDGTMPELDFEDYPDNYILDAE
jgi:hypothetical protein